MLNRMQRVLFALLVAAAGLYTGVLLMYSVGIAPVLDTMDPDSFLRFWQTHDYFLHLRIRFLYGILGALYLLTFGSLATHLRSPSRAQRCMFLLVGAAFLCSAAEVGVNRGLQRPVNRSIRLADVGTHSAASVYGMERQVFRAIHVRQVLSASAFGLLIAAVMLLKDDSALSQRRRACRPLTPPGELRGGFPHPSV